MSSFWTPTAVPERRSLDRCKGGRLNSDAPSRERFEIAIRIGSSLITTGITSTQKLRKSTGLCGTVARALKLRKTKP